MKAPVSAGMSRRQALAWVGATAIGGGALLAQGGRRAARSVGVASPGGRAAELSELLAPFSEGSRVGRWKVVRLGTLTDGASSVVMQDARGATFQLDICARDDSHAAPVPPARSECFDVFLSNRGSGKTASYEQHGLAAMAIADVIRQNEARLQRDGYHTLRERLSHAYDRVRSHA